MNDLSIRVEGVAKQYRLGKVGTGTLRHDLNRFWHTVRGKEDPYLKIGQANDRSKKADSEYVWALSDISFDVKQGEVLGIIGRNGAGKSTLLKILSKITAPTRGCIHVNGRIASLLEVGTGFHPDLSGRENIFLNGAILGMRRWEIQKKFDEIVDFAGVEAYIDTPVKRYSSGMYVRLAFAVAAFLEPEILIVDEVLAVGDAEFQKKCLGRMKDVSNNDGRTVLFVSHNMGAVANLCDRVLLLRNGCIQCINTPEEGIAKYLSVGQKDSIDSDHSSRFENAEYIKGIRANYKTNFQHFNVFDPLEFEIQMGEKVTKLDHPRFGITISSIEGDPILSGITGDFKIETNKNIRLHISHCDLTPGSYLLSISIGIGSLSEARKEYEVLRDILEFNIENFATDNVPLINWKKDYGKLVHRPAHFNIKI